VSNHLFITYVFKATGTPTNIWIYGGDATHPFTVKDALGSAINWASTSTGGTTFRIQNALLTNLGYAGILSNVGNGSAIDNSQWNGLKYKKNVFSFVKIDGKPTEGEGFYGGTTHTPYGVCDEHVMLHCAVFNKGREGYQNEHSNKLSVYNCTAYNVGQGLATHGSTDQIFLAQFHDVSNAIIEN
jgi:hypothetical protein